jgi:hypothetical protein
LKTNLYHAIMRHFSEIQLIADEYGSDPVTRDGKSLTDQHWQSTL